MKCDKCGSEIKEGEIYCKNCGNKIETQNNVLAIISIVFGVLSIFIGSLFIPFAIIGLIIGICQSGKSPLKTTGIVLNIIGFTIGLILWTLIFSFIFKAGSTVIDNKIDNGFIDKTIETVKRFIGLESESKYWSKYKDERIGALGKERTLVGLWKQLGSDKKYYELTEDTICIYNDIENKSNSKCGTYKISDFDDEDNSPYINNIKDKIMDKGIFFIEVNFINETIGETKEEEVELLWILIDHEEEGIEAKVIEDENSSKVKIFAKMSD